MVAELTKSKTLYDIDYNLWVLDTVAKLKKQEFSALDLDNLIEEVADLSRRDKKKLKSLLRLLFEHLLKLSYWKSEAQNNRNHWEAEILNFRQLIQDELADSPSLKIYLQEIWQECYQYGRKIAAKRSQLPLSEFPEQPIATLEQILDENGLP